MTYWIMLSAFAFSCMMIFLVVICSYVSGYKNRFQNFIKYLREMGDEVCSGGHFLSLIKMLTPLNSFLEMKLVVSVP